MMREGQSGRIFVGRLSHGADLLAELTRVAVESGVRCGRVEALGAVQKARVGCYDQRAKQYGYLEFNGPMEILALLGNVSAKAEAPEQPFVHAHVTLADEKGRACGGHLAEGTVIFAAEFRLEELKGVELVRRPDAATGLALWA